MKQEEKSMASKGRVLEAAASLFIRKGYEETTMQDIMEESGLSKGAIYHHFAGKQEILSTMIADAQMKVNTFFQEMEENAEMTVKEKISRIIRYFFDNKNQSMLIRNRWVEKVPYALVDTVRNGNAFIAPRVAGIIKQGNENGEFRCDFPEELAEFYETKRIGAAVDFLYACGRSRRMRANCCGQQRCGFQCTGTGTGRIQTGRR